MLRHEHNEWRNSQWVFNRLLLASKVSYFLYSYVWTRALHHYLHGWRWVTGIWYTQSRYVYLDLPDHTGYHGVGVLGNLLNPLTGYQRVPGNYSYLVPHTRYQVFCSTRYRLLLFSYCQLPPGSYLLGCRNLVWMSPHSLKCRN